MLPRLDNTNIQSLERLESNVKSDLLILLMSKQAEFRSAIPADWTYCMHVDVQPSDDWLEPESLIAILKVLISALAHSRRTPIDFCAVKSPGVDSIVVRTTEPGATVAA